MHKTKILKADEPVIFQAQTEARQNDPIRRPLLLRAEEQSVIQTILCSVNFLRRSLELPAQPSDQKT